MPKRGVRRLSFGQKLVNSTISMPIDAWVVLDLLAEEDNMSTGAMVTKLLNAEAGRRLNKGGLAHRQREAAEVLDRAQKPRP